MYQIHQPHLSVEPIQDHPGQRTVRVSYELVAPGSDDAARASLTERIVVHAIDEHDAPVRPTRTPLLAHEATFVAPTATVERVLDRTVSRVTLDVERDWWASDLDGSVIPIAEWVDHIIAEIQLVVDGRLVHEAETPVVSGSWGALGSD